MGLNTKEILALKIQAWNAAKDVVAQYHDEIKTLQCQLKYEENVKLEESKRVLDESFSSLKRCIVRQPKTDPLYGYVIREVSYKNQKSGGNLIVMVGDINKPTETFISLLSISPRYVEIIQD